ncbi:DivIVA domain-containing protein [Lacticigenium naphthae]|uniref:DivIVA domain-containing protein n=1 Tax=Lacticigenium naphthae TaxID=515351 RepID=UPI000A077E51|nr:DivIVA domain-containing protein [Lacticigenium naphthae]
MALTPMDIHNKEFSVKMRGYDQDDVNDYLDQIIKDYELLLKQKKELEKQLSFAEEKLTHYDSLQDSLNRSILVAQEAADRLKENTSKEAEMIVREAESNADQLLKDAVEKARTIEHETESLRKESRVFRQRLQLMIESQLELIKKGEWDDILQVSATEKVELPTINKVSSELDNKNQSENIDEEILEAKEGMEDEEGNVPAVEMSTTK